MMLRKTNSGLTLIELLIVIVLLGILSVTALPRFIGKGGVEETTVRDQLIAVLRLSQTQAMQNTNIPLAVTLAQATSVVLEPDSTLTLQLFDTKGSGGNLIQEFRFNSLGQPIRTANVNPYQSGLRFVIEGSVSAVVCIESEGYIHPC